MSFIVCNRFWAQKVEDLERLETFVEDKLQIGAHHVFVAVNVDEDKQGTLKRTWPDKVTVFGVTPWGKFIPALHALLGKGRPLMNQGLPILMLSAEFPVLSRYAVDVLLKNLTSDTLAAGARLHLPGNKLVGHTFHKGWKGEANGNEVPWNACTAWNPELLWPYGFPNIGEGIMGDEANAGVEEFCLYALAQKNSPEGDEVKVKLIDIPGVVWATKFDDDPDRREYYKNKMQSKIDRPARQLKVLRLPSPVVEHIDVS